MADKKISALTSATTPLAGTEVLPIVQGGSTVKVSVANLTAGRTVSASALGVGTASPLTAINLEGGSFLLRGGVMDMGPTAGADGAGRISTARGGDGVSGILMFSTQNPSAAIVEAMRIDGSGNITTKIGNLVVGTAGKGIVDSTSAVSLNFSSTGATLNSMLSQTGAINTVTNDFSSHVTTMNNNDTLTISNLNSGIIEISEMNFWLNVAVIAVNGASTAIVYASDANITVTSGNANTINVYRSGANVIIESKNAAGLSVRTNIRKLG